MKVITSTKFWIAVVTLTYITGIYGYAMYLEVQVPTEYTALMVAIASSFGLLKTYQNVALSNGNGNGGEQ